MLQKTLLAAAQFVALPIGDGGLFVFLRNAVPKVFDELETLGPSEFEERRKFRVHTAGIPLFQLWCNSGGTQPCRLHAVDLNHEGTKERGGSGSQEKRNVSHAKRGLFRFAKEALSCLPPSAMPTPPCPYPPAATYHARCCYAFSANEARNNAGTQTRTSTTCLSICAALFCLLASGGCAATSSVLSGNRIETRPIFTPTQSAPHAIRRADGTLVITANFQTIQKATIGGLFSSDRSLYSEKKMIVVPTSELRPAESVIAGIFKPYDRAMLRTMLNTPIDNRSPNTRNAKLTVLEGWPTNGSQFVCPSHECVIYSRDFVWYVPASGSNGAAKAAVIPGPQSRTPLSAYPKRAALLPAALVGDLIINTWVGAAIVSGKPIDL